MEVICFCRNVVVDANSRTKRLRIASSLVDCGKPDWTGWCFDLQRQSRSCRTNHARSVT